MILHKTDPSYLIILHTVHVIILHKPDPGNISILHTTGTFRKTDVAYILLKTRYNFSWGWVGAKYEGFFL